MFLCSLVTSASQMTSKPVNVNLFAEFCTVAQRRMLRLLGIKMFLKRNTVVSLDYSSGCCAVVFFLLPFRERSSSTSSIRLPISGGSLAISLSLTVSFRSFNSWKSG